MAGEYRSWRAVALLVCLAAVCGVGTAAAEAPGPLQWTVFDGGADELGADIIEVEVGGYAVAGTARNESSERMLLLRTDENGSVLWNRTYALSGADAAYAVRQTADGGYVLAGEEDGHPALIGTGPEGEVLWTGPEGINVTEYGPVRDLVVTDDGGYVLAGSALAPGGEETAALIRTNESGHVEWVQIYEDLNESRATALATAGESGYAVAGLSSASEEVFLLTTGADGNLTWTRTFPALEIWPVFSDIRALMIAPDLARRAGGGYAVAGGVTFPERPVSTAVLLLTDENGTMERNWTYQRDGDFWAESLVRTPDDGFVLACYLDPLANPTNAVVLIRTDENGTSQWEVDATPGFLNPSDNDPHSIIVTTGGGYAVTGETLTIDPETGLESLDLFILLTGQEQTG
ncbi:hypothetical protein E2N92_12885 [Methanofollis formosanus]|uniref:PQQ-binding-like beta-propeller repeat protein n=1 Tax=Methanofollis formosanus TaxID=299308 RepID=A0A8G1A547_9EURY|nr:hypothetical protein [Methanofollis formosanus]QYZ80262.1 hypothetical protein E2N92_12885 [Methanofollis formosanus]